MFSAKPEQRLHIRENFLLAASSGGFRECVVRIANPSAGEIAPVVWITAPRHSNFVAIIKFWNATQRERESERKLQLCGRAAPGVRETRHVVIREKWNEHIRTSIQRIVPQHIG